MTSTPIAIPTPKPIFAPVVSPELLLDEGSETADVAVAVATDELGVDPVPDPEPDELELESKAVDVACAELPSKLYPFI